VSLVRITPPKLLAVTTDDQKSFSRIDCDDDDAILATFIAAAQQQCEIYTRRRFVTQTWKYFPRPEPIGGGHGRRRFFGLGNLGLYFHEGFELPFPPCQSIVRVGYLDQDGQEQTLAEDVDYRADLEHRPARILPVQGVIWPVNYLLPNALWCQFVCGEDLGDLSALLKMAIMTLADNFYDKRATDDCMPGQVKEMLTYERVLV
jgi:hypothetical protein